MAQVALLTKGIVYDTSRQVVTLHQVVERFMLGDSLCEKCIVTEIMFDEHAGYTYTLIGLKSLRNFRTRFIFDEHESASGFFAISLTRPSWRPNRSKRSFPVRRPPRSSAARKQLSPSGVCIAGLLS